MKKIVGLVLSLALVFALAVPTFAATNQDVINAINSGVTVNGVTKQIPAQYTKAVSDFLAANNLTSAELDTLVADINSAKTTWAATGKVNFKDMTAAEQQKLIDMAAATAKKVGATLTFDGKTIKVVDKNGKIFTVAATTTTAGGNVIKTTGLNVNVNGMVAVAGLVVVTLAGCAVFVLRRQGAK